VPPSLSPRRIVLALFVPVAAVAANPSWAAAIGLDVWNLPALHARLEIEAEKRRAFEAQDAELMQRMELKERLVADLIDGRTTLAEVTSDFLTLNRRWREYPLPMPAGSVGQTEEERAARDVLVYAALRTDHLPPARRAVVMAGLEVELSRYVATVTAKLN
jgi:hypothetical protein